MGSAMAHIEPNCNMWATSAIIVAALVLYAWERIPMEVSVGGGDLCAVSVLSFFSTRWKKRHANRCTRTSETATAF